jgi:hypothetical protein
MSDDRPDNVSTDPRSAPTVATLMHNPNAPASAEYAPRQTGDPKLDAINNSFTLKIHSATPTDLHPAILDNLGPALAAIGSTGLGIYRAAKEALGSHYNELSLQADAVQAAQRPNMHPITRMIAGQQTVIADEDKPALASALSASFERDSHREARLIPIVEKGLQTIQADIDKELKAQNQGSIDTAAIAGIWQFVGRQKDPFSFVANLIKQNHRREVTANRARRIPSRAGRTSSVQVRQTCTAEPFTLCRPHHEVPDFIGLVWWAHKDSNLGPAD